MFLYPCPLPGRGATGCARSPFQGLLPVTSLTKGSRCICPLGHLTAVRSSLCLGCVPSFDFLESPPLPCEPPCCLLPPSLYTPPPSMW